MYVQTDRPRREEIDIYSRLRDSGSACRHEESLAEDLISHYISEMECALCGRGERNRN